VYIGNQICEGLNNVDGNNNRRLINPNTFLWLPGKTVWLDVIGINESINTIVAVKGAAYMGFYSKNKEFVHTFFLDE
jgi:hypothetical protein